MSHIHAGTSTSAGTGRGRGNGRRRDTNLRRRGLPFRSIQLPQSLHGMSIWNSVGLIVYGIRNACPLPSPAETRGSSAHRTTVCLQSSTDHGRCQGFSCLLPHCCHPMAFGVCAHSTSRDKAAGFHSGFAVDGEDTTIPGATLLAHGAVLPAKRSLASCDPGCVPVTLPPEPPDGWPRLDSAPGQSDQQSAPTTDRRPQGRARQCDPPHHQRPDGALHLMTPARWLLTARSASPAQLASPPQTHARISAQAPHTSPAPHCALLGPRPSFAHRGVWRHHRRSGSVVPPPDLTRSAPDA